MDVSFSGLLTYVEKEAKTKVASGEVSAADLCYSLQVHISQSCAHSQLLLSQILHNLHTLCYGISTPLILFAVYQFFMLLYSGAGDYICDAGGDN